MPWFLPFLKNPKPMFSRWLYWKMSFGGFPQSGSGPQIKRKERYVCDDYFKLV